MSFRPYLRPPYNALLLVSGNGADASDRSNYARSPTVGAGVTFPSRVLDFDGGTTAVVTYPDAAEFESAPFSVAFWARIDSSSTRVSLVAKNTTTASPELYRGWYIHFIGTAAGSNGMIVTCNKNTTNYQLLYSGNATTYGDGTWRHFAWTCDSISSNANWKFYVNGALISMTSLTAGTTNDLSNGEPLTLGGFTTLNQTARLNGALDEVWIGDTVLSAAEVYNLYINGLGATRP